MDEDTLFQKLVAQESTCLRCQCVDIQVILHLEACDHRFCRNCLNSGLTSDDSNYRQRIACPQNECMEIIPAYIIRQVLDPSEYEALENLSIESVLSTQDYIRCPSCQQSFEKEPGKLLGPNMDPVRSLDGSEMSSAALLHRARHRFRCLCGVDFCDACSSSPYHNGFDCDAYKAYSISSFCRFCHAVLPRRRLSRKSDTLAECCSDESCVVKAKAACKKTLPCSHPCSGIARESRCLPCLRCPDKNNHIGSDDFCNICWVESLGSGPCIQLDCGHIFHSACVKERIEKRWPGSRISFGFLSCPLCHAAITHSSLKSSMRQGDKLRRGLIKLALERLRLERMTDHDDINTPGSPYYNSPEAFALAKFAFYQCYKCKKPYFGGKRECGNMAGLDEEQFDASELLCATCSGSPSSCSVHGADFIEYKCRFCCQIAVWFCRGTTHYCDRCHSGKKPFPSPACPGSELCPLGVDHPPNGTEFSLGCALCRRGRQRPSTTTNSSAAQARPIVELIDLDADDGAQPRRRQRQRLQDQDHRDVIVLD